MRPGQISQTLTPSCISPVSAFVFDKVKLPSLKALDKNSVVIQIGSFSKLIHPGLRVGYIVSDQISATGGRLINELSKVKSISTINTSSLPQAIVGGLLLSCDMSLQTFVAPKISYYRSRRDCMLSSLDAVFQNCPVSWTRPAGGFFLTFTLPSVFGTNEMEQCARDYGLICTPMSYFALTSGQEKKIRLAYSHGSDDEIREGCHRLRRFLDNSN
jgi:(S)-3,5-dihydroxyphenylglycine transaminase